MRHCDDRYGNTANCHDDVFDQVAKYNAMHSPQDRIKNCKQCENYTIKMRYVLGRDVKWHILLHLAPWNKYFNEFSQTHKTVSQKSKTSYQCKCDHYIV